MYDLDYVIKLHTGVMPISRECLVFDVLNPNTLQTTAVKLNVTQHQLYKREREGGRERAERLEMQCNLCFLLLHSIKRVLYTENEQ